MPRCNSEKIIEKSFKQRGLSSVCVIYVVEELDFSSPDLSMFYRHTQIFLLLRLTDWLSFFASTPSRIKCNRWRFGIGIDSRDKISITRRREAILRIDFLRAGSPVSLFAVNVTVCRRRIFLSSPEQVEN